jgi:hypothetical protein
MSNSVIPIIVMPSPIDPAPGSTISVTVTMDQVTTPDQPVAIVSSPTGFFSSIPAEVTVRSGQSQVTFGATVSSGASGSSSITASCNNHSASVNLATQGSEG